ncbi:helix-turn-helix domain-containing protein [Actinoplanes sp. NPDC049596]|uniref:PucR family transcriptional regulator n=1 Tax=unclassified Actinoplanes TaxID=2626549 RepID=UPI0034147026
MRARPSTLPITLGELARVRPLAGAELHLADPARAVEQVVLAETFERLRHCLPHELVVLHDEAATGGWSLAAALHLAWERNLSAVVVSRAVAGASSAALAERLAMSLVVIDEDPVEVALQLAGQVSAPAAARAQRQARVAEQLAEQTGIRGVVGVLNRELQGVPVALVVGDVVVAGQAAALTEKGQVRPIEVEVHGSAAKMVAAVPVPGPAAVDQVASLLRLARPSLQAAWARSRLDAAARASHEQAAFELLRRLGSGEAPSWTAELGWQVGLHNRAVWLAPVHPEGEPSDEVTYLIRASWQRGHSTWPLIAEGDGWISWHSAGDPDDLTALRRALTGFRDSAVAHRLVLGVGRAHEGVDGLMRSVAEARLAAHVAREAGTGSVQWFDQVGAAAALAWLPTTEIAQVADLTLAELMAAKDRAPLVQTVLAVLDAGGSLSQASKQLGVHRNTVLARLARARQLGLTYDEPGQRLALHVLCYSLTNLWSESRSGSEPSPP